MRDNLLIGLLVLAGVITGAFIASTPASNASHEVQDAMDVLCRGAGFERAQEYELAGPHPRVNCVGENGHMWTALNSG
jgi:hypothetical protein